MKKQYKWYSDKGAKIHILRRSIGLFGEQWDCCGTFDDRDGNLARCKQIVKLLNECDKHTDHPNQDE